MVDEDRQPAAVEVVDVTTLLADGTAQRVAWSASNQLQTNLVVLGPGEGVEPHAEPELDVTLALLRGSLELRVGDDPPRTVAAPAVVVLPAGTRRSLSAGPDGGAYLTAHRRRTGLLPRLR